MSLSEVFNNRKTKTAGPHELNKLVALLSLEEALVAEEYEVCAGLIATAKGYGAHPGEIRKVLAGSARRSKRWVPVKRVVKKGRLWFKGGGSS